MESAANVRFEFVSEGHSDIRISFVAGDGSWSYLGTRATQFSHQDATMNFGWFDFDTSPEEFRRTTIHEFGHALGLVHEHSHPGADIPWNRPVVYAYYLQSQGWNAADVNDQVFRRYSTTQTNYCAYDRQSIMHYPIPQEFTRGNYSVGWNASLSDGDRRTLRNMYPFPGELSPYWTTAGNADRWYVGDFNGDGMDDIFHYAAGRSGAEVLLSNGEQFMDLTSWTGAGRGDQDWYIGDFNGDGMDDIFRYSRGITGAHMFTSTGTSFYSLDQGCNFFGQ